MYRIALNVGISHVRSNSRRIAHHVPLDDDMHDRLGDPRSEEADSREQILYAFIDTFDPLHRALLLLYLDDHSYREISGILGITETNVATKISRLKQRIRNEVKG
jgi:RNA polymerase sigma-70 factor (ECF subfamily)